jgi:hypothetical protein
MTVNGDEPPMPDPGVNSLYRHCEHCFPFWPSDFLLTDRVCLTGTQMWRSGLPYFTQFNLKAGI